MARGYGLTKASFKGTMCTRIHPKIHEDYCEKGRRRREIKDSKEGEQAYNNSEESSISRKWRLNFTESTNPFTSEGGR
jgi:hypothetical protein